MPNGNVDAILLIAAGLVTIIGTLVVFIRKIVRQSADLARANAELAAAVSAAEASRARAELEAAHKARLAALLDAALASAPIGLGFVDRQLRFLRVNRTFAEITGWSMEDHIGATMRDIDPRLAEHVEPQLRRALATRKPVTNVEFAAAAPADPEQPRNWLSSYYPIVTDDGDLFGIG